MELTWVNRGLVVLTLEGKTLSIEGEALLEHDPDFLIFARTITKWDDGTPIGEDEREELLSLVLGEATKRGWIFEIER